MTSENPLMFKTGSTGNWTFWVLTSKPLPCSVCKKPITEYSAGLIVDWTKEGCFINYLHDACIKQWKKHPLSVTQNRLMVNFTDFIPERGIPVFMRKPSFTPRKGDVTVFEPDKTPSSNVTDRTRYAPLLDGEEPVTIGSPDIERLDALESPVSDVNGLLEGLRGDSRRALEEKAKGLLEVKKQ